MKTKDLQSHRRCSRCHPLPIGLILGCLSLLLGLSTALGDGYFSARNLGGVPVSGWGYERLSKESARIEILDEDLLLVRGGFCYDGFFALGTVYDPKPGTVRTLTVRVWDTSVAETYEQAQASGFGFALVKQSVPLSTGPIPPASLGANFYGPMIRRLPDVPLGFNPAFYLRGSYSDSLITPRSGATYQLYLPNPAGLAFPLTNSVKGPYGFGFATGHLHWVYTLIEPPHVFGWRASAIMRVWDSASGANYETAKLRGAATVVLDAGESQATPSSSNPFPISLVQAESPSVGVFQAPGGVLRIVDTQGNPVPKGGCQVEILAGTNLLKSVALPEDGQLPLPPTPVPGTLPLDGAVIMVRIWNPRSGPSFDEASIVGTIGQALQLGGDNLPAATLYTNVVQLAVRAVPPVTTPPDVVPSLRQRLSVAAGSPSSLSVTAFGGELQYAWQFAGDGDAWIALEDTPSMKGTHSAILEFPAATIQQAGRYRVVVSNRIGSVTNTPTALFVHDSGAIQLVPSAPLRFGSDTVLQPFTVDPLPVSLSVTAGPASVFALPDGRFRVHPTGVGSVSLHASQTTSTPYAILAADFVFPVLKAQQSLLLPDLPSVVESGASLPVTVTSNSGLPVGVQVVSGPATLTGGLLQTFGPGTVVLHASQAGSENYEATEATLSIPVATRPQSVRLNDHGGTFTLSFRGDAGRVHLVESAPSVEGPWGEVARGTGNGLDRDTTVPLAGLTASNRFFRIRIP